MKGDLKKRVTHMSTTKKLSKILSLTLLLGIAMFDNNYAAEESLKPYFGTNNIINFGSNSIKVNGEDKTASIKGEEFVIDSGNNTTYIDMNTLPIQNSIGGGGSISKYSW